MYRIEKLENQKEKKIYNRNWKRNNQRKKGNRDWKKIKIGKKGEKIQNWKEDKEKNNKSKSKKINK